MAGRPFPAKRADGICLADTSRSRTGRSRCRHYQARWDGRGALSKACSPRARTGSTSSTAASCPTSGARPRSRCRRSDQAFRSRWDRCHSATRRRGSSSPPGAGGPGADPEDPAQAWKGRMGIDAKWENIFVVVNANGDIVESWTQWDKIFRRPHAVYVNPYDAEKHVWVVDDHGEDLLELTHDGKQLVN